MYAIIIKVFYKDVHCSLFLINITQAYQLMSHNSYI